MIDLTFARADLEALAAYFAAHGDITASTWNIIHQTLHASSASRSEVEDALAKLGIRTIYADETDHEEMRYFLDSMEAVAADIAVIETRIARVLEVLQATGAEYNQFYVSGSRGEDWPGIR